jgi:ferredoxin
MRVQVDTSECVGSGQCVMTAPAVFDQREEDGIVALLTDRPPAGDQEDVRHAAGMCPARAITVTEDADADAAATAATAAEKPAPGPG